MLDERLDTAEGLTEGEHLRAPADLERGGLPRGESNFLEWMAASVDKEADFSDEEESELAYAGDPDDADF